MACRNQFFFGFITGVLINMFLFGVFHMKNSSTDIQLSAQAVLRLKSQGPADQILQSDEDRFNTPWPKIKGLLQLHSDNHQEADTILADYLYTKVRILCLIMTSPSNLQKKAIHVYEAWAHKCNVVIFVSSQENNAFPAPVIKVETEEGRQHLTAKTMHAFKYVYDKYFDKADWFMKADDDSFAIMENLRYILKDKNPMDPVYYGHRFKTFVGSKSYYSGSGGYVLSKEALQRFAEKGFHQKWVCREDGGAEDAEFGKCMQELGVHTADSYDENGASRFYDFKPPSPEIRKYRNKYFKYVSRDITQGVENVSDYPIMFHGITPRIMRNLAWYTYHMKINGRRQKFYPKLHEYYTSRNNSILHAITHS